MILNMNNNIFKIDLIPDNTEISISEDETILTASLRNDIQHHHACGGLGMCSTCRVEIIEGEDNLSPKSKSEQNLSDGLFIGATILCVSIFFRTIDEPICHVVSTGTHFVWHILNAVMLAWMIEVLRRHMLAGHLIGR